MGPDVLLAPAPWPIDVAAVLAVAFVALRGSTAAPRQRRAELAADALLATHAAALALRDAYRRRAGSAGDQETVLSLEVDLDACAWRTLDAEVARAAAAYLRAGQSYAAEESDAQESGEEVAFDVLLRVLAGALRRHRG